MTLLLVASEQSAIGEVRSRAFARMRVESPMHEQDLPEEKSKPEQPERRPSSTHSVLKSVARRTGETPQVLLRDVGSGRERSPIIDAHSSERDATPAGRGHYQLMGEIARGGMGVVLKGHDLDLGRDVALKVLHKDLAEHPETLARFVEEAQIGGQLQHPGIVSVYELGLMEDERPFFTMKLVKGRTLSALLSERETPASERRRFLGIFEAICQTMAYAHSRGVIHRDLKPANVMVGAFGEVQVVDWGLAKVMTSGGTADEKRARDARLTAISIIETVRSDGSGSGSDSVVGSVMGTPAYMPPEQASGEIEKLDERSDVFSLGAFLFEILTGRPPYGGDRDQALFSAANAKLDDAYAWLDSCDADPEMKELVRQCLKPAQAARPRTAEVLAERVHQHLAAVEERAHAAQIEVAVQRKARKLTVALAATVLVAALGGAGGWTWLQGERVAREREEGQRAALLVTNVNDALNEVAGLRGEGRFAEALTGLEGTRTMAEGGGASEALLARISAAMDEVDAAVEEQRLAKNRERQADEVLQALYQASEDAGSSEVFNRARSWGETDLKFGEVFAEQGVDVQTLSAEEVGRLLTRAGLAERITPLLDRWIAVRRRAKNDSGALELVEIAHEVDGDRVRADLREAIINDDPEALRWLAEGDLEAQPPATLYLLATALDLVEEKDESLRILREAVRSHPGDLLLRTALFGILSRAKRFEDALPHLHAAEALQPENTSLLATHRHFLEMIGAAARARGDVARAQELGREEITYLEKLVERDPHPWRYSTLGRAYCMLGDAEQALAAYDRAAREQPDSQYVLAQAGQYLQLVGEYDEAVRYLESLLSEHPYHWSGMFHLARALASQGKLSESIEVYSSLVDQHPDYALGVNNLAWALATSANEELRDYPEAQRLAEETVRLDPEAEESWNTLGVARFRTDDLEGAVQAMLRSVELRGQMNAIDGYIMAVAHHRLGEPSAARMWYERARALSLEGSTAETVREVRSFQDEAQRELGLTGD